MHQLPFIVDELAFTVVAMLVNGLLVQWLNDTTSVTKGFSNGSSGEENGSKSETKRPSMGLSSDHISKSQST